MSSPGRSGPSWRVFCTVLQHSAGGLFGVLGVFFFGLCLALFWVLLGVLLGFVGVLGVFGVLGCWGFGVLGFLARVQFGTSANDSRVLGCLAITQWRRRLD